ncbi:TetR/AcrR family transcriptional regulator [Paraburkholderia sp. BL10I2N1]|uniref:TetR/AcrR family transcriptional regulator n=1 Tax=Paraburkholderia sp. BL10I2N1 TaxID=1938796 RepID=UPI0010603F12|nr:TetR/AcrR family transcriptional regulator [Paraburkholderia sp. BL10I2N1]TDN59171.1 TetR family transcriptional regulator [Paraburkholderia sp. BL10I2N1]
MKEMIITSAEMLGSRAPEEPRRRGNRTTRVPEILEVSISVFASEGNAGFTQRRVASDAGVRLSTLQHYFGTREDLLRATLKAMANRYLELYRTIARDKLRSPEARLDAIVDEAFAALTGPGTNVSAFALESWSLAEHEAFARDLTAEITGEFQEIFATLVAKINPALTSGECALRGALLISHLQGLVVFIRRAGENAPDLDAFRAAAKVVWKALSKAPQ